MESRSVFEYTLEKFKSDLSGFIKDNSHRIACTISYSVEYKYQPFLSGYQKYFNENVNKIYKSNAFSANTPDLPNFLCTYFVLFNEKQKENPETVKEHCEIYVNNFIDFNKDTLTGLSAQIYDVATLEKIKEYTHGDTASLKDIDFLNI
ncbi:MAG: hypothetical protein ACRENO_02175 [Thermodesulfobacteriota bacterium]